MDAGILQSLVDAIILMRVSERKLRLLRCGAIFLLVLPLCVAVRAATDDVVTYAFSHGQTYDNNIFRLSDGVSPAGGGERSDFFTQDSVRVEINKEYSLQQLHYSIDANALRYRNYSYLNNDSANQAASWGWRSGNRFDGVLSAAKQTTQTSFADVRTPLKSETTTASHSAGLNYWLQADWFVGVRQDWSHTYYSSDQMAASENVTTLTEWSLNYKPASGNSVGLLLHNSDGRYPTPQFVSGVGAVSNDYRQQDVSVDVRWVPTGKSSVAAVLSKTRRNYADLDSRDYSGQTGNLSWNWAVSGKLSFTAILARELSGGTDVSASLAQKQSRGLAAAWALTTKTSLNLNYANDHTLYAGDPSAAAGAPIRDERTHSWSLGGSWQPDRNWSLAANAKREKRDSNYAGYSYEDTTLSGQATFKF